MRQTEKPNKARFLNIIILVVGVLILVIVAILMLVIYLQTTKADSAHAAWRERTIACVERWDYLRDEVFESFKQEDDGETRLYRSDAIYFSEKHGSCILYMPVRSGGKYAIINDSYSLDYIQVEEGESAFMKNIVFGNNPNIIDGWQKSPDIMRKIEAPCCD